MPIAPSAFQAVAPGAPPGSAGGLAPAMGSQPVPPEALQPQLGQQQPQEPDLFQRVIMLMMDPDSKQINPLLAMFFAGMGVREALEKSGKFVSKPHRSNQELAAMGVDPGIQGQTGMPDPRQMAQMVRPPGAAMPPMPGAA